MAPMMMMTVNMAVTQMEMCTEKVYTRWHSKCLRHFLYPHKTIWGSDFWTSQTHPLICITQGFYTFLWQLHVFGYKIAEWKMQKAECFFLLPGPCNYKENPPVPSLILPKSHLTLCDLSHVSNTVSKGQSLQMRVNGWFLLSQILGLTGNAILLLSSSFTCPYI